MKMVLSEPPVWANKRVELRLEKPERDERMEILHGDTGTKIMEITIERSTRNVVVDVMDVPEIIVTGKGGGVAQVVKKAKPKNKDQTWAVEDEMVEDESKPVNSATGLLPQKKTGRKVLRVWNPSSGKEVFLPIADKPGEYTPINTPEQPIHEVQGQPDMLFALAVGIRERKHVLLEGPTGIAKTSAARWLASLLNYNLIVQPIARGTQDRHLTGEYAPAGVGDFRWMDGPTTRAARASQTHPTILLYDELNRIGNVAEFARVYQLIDDTRTLELPERRTEKGEVEKIVAGDLYVMATANPVEDDGADYVGVKELDPAFISRFPIKPPLAYPKAEIEASALAHRVESLSMADALKMVKCAQRIRDSHEVRFPISFRELEAWGVLLQYHSWQNAAEQAVISKAAPMFRGDIRNLLQLTG
jgi:MoxR-like ATPase